MKHKNTWLFLSVPNINMAQIIKNIPHGRQWPTLSTQSISRLLMTWRRKEPGHKQPLYWSNPSRIFQPQNHQDLFTSTDASVTATYKYTCRELPRSLTWPFTLYAWDERGSFVYTRNSTHSMNSSGGRKYTDPVQFQAITWKIKW